MEVGLGLITREFIYLLLVSFQLWIQTIIGPGNYRLITQPFVLTVYDYKY